jgi:hypothetical protein
MEERFRALLLLLSLSLLLGAHGSLRTLQVSIHPMKPPITQPFDPNLALNSTDLPSTDTRVVKKAAGCEQPEQVCITTATYISNVVRRSGVPETHTGYIFQHPVSPPCHSADVTTSCCSGATWAQQYLCNSFSPPQPTSTRTRRCMHAVCSVVY